jgi:hypothetical protein
MMTEFLADTRQSVSPGDIRTLKLLRDGLFRRASPASLARLVDNQLAWIGPPPQETIGISYRGRKALRDAEEVVYARTRFASALRLVRTRGRDATG